MKIVRLSWRPRPYMDTVLAGVDASTLADYGALMRHIVADFWGTSDAWEHTFAERGHSCELFLVNVKELQDAWWGSNGQDSGGDFVESAVRSRDPDVLIVEGVEFFSLNDLTKFRSYLRSNAILVGVSGPGVYDSRVFSVMDVFFTCRPDYAAELRTEGLDAVHLPHAFDDRVLSVLSRNNSLAPAESRIPFGFIGSILPGSRLHDGRRKVLQAIASRFDFPFYSPSSVTWTSSMLRWLGRTAAYGAAKPMKKALSQTRSENAIVSALAKAAKWNEAPRPEYIPYLTPKMRPPVFGLEMYEALSSMQTTLNMQPGLSNNYATNMRLFEATGVGTCLVTDDAIDIGDFFGDDEVVVFRSAGEAIEKVSWLIDHPRDAMEIARRGQRRTLADHTYRERLEVLSTALHRALANVGRKHVH